LGGISTFRTGIQSLTKRIRYAQSGEDVRVNREPELVSRDNAPGFGILAFSFRLKPAVDLMSAYGVASDQDPEDNELRYVLKEK
jgi:hypothetical protein